MLRMQKITTQSVTAKLRNHFKSGKLTNREHVTGYNVKKLNNYICAVFHKNYGSEKLDYMEQSKIYESILTESGFTVERPFLDKAILQVTKL
jgi:hypothetical protein